MSKRNWLSRLFSKESGEGQEPPLVGAEADATVLPATEPAEGREVEEGRPDASAPEPHPVAPEPEATVLPAPEPPAEGPQPALTAPAQPALPDPAAARPAEDDVPLEWQVGDTILDLYEVKEQFTSGGMGLVYRVHHRAGTSTWRSRARGPSSLRPRRTATTLCARPRPGSTWACIPTSSAATMCAPWAASRASLPSTWRAAA